MTLNSLRLTIRVNWNKASLVALYVLRAIATVSRPSCLSVCDVDVPWAYICWVIVRQ